MAVAPPGQSVFREAVERKERMMGSRAGLLSMPGVGFFGMLIIGVLAGWIAEKAMNRDHGLLTNMLVGIAGSFVGGALAGLLDIQFYGFLGNLVVAIVGAVLILWVFGRSEPGARGGNDGFGDSGRGR